MGKHPREEDDGAFSATNHTGYGDLGVSLPPEDSPTPKLVAVDAGLDRYDETVMMCSLPPHRGAISFKTIDAFNIHYSQEHTNRCSSCGKNFPTAHFLTLHIDEHHNPLREALAAKGEKTYACFVEDCERKCSTPQKRRLHLIDKHMFPKLYNFRVVDSGTDKSTSMLREGQKRRVSTTSSPSTGFQRRTSNVSTRNMTAPSKLDSPEAALPLQPEDESHRTQYTPNLPTTRAHRDAIDQLEKSFDALSFVPPSVSARQRAQKPQK